MTHMTYSQLQNFLSTMTTHDLELLRYDVATIIRDRRREEAALLRDRLNVGDAVMVPLTRAGKICFPQEGIVKKVMYNEALVEVKGHEHKLPLTMLSIKE